MIAARLAFALLEPMPGIAAALAERAFFTPPRPRAKRPAGAERQRLASVRGLELTAWAWGSGPSVLLLHGWGGAAAQFAPLAALLAARGFRALALEAPGHGFSGGSTSSMPEFAEAALAAGRRFGPFQAVVGHSMGGAALSLALRDGLQAQRAVFVATPRNPADWTQRFAETLGIGADVLARMQERSERRLGFRWEELDAARIAPRMTIPLLVVHDVDDREVAFAEGEALAQLWPDARLVRTRGLGHNRILRDPEVNARVADHVAGRAPAEQRAAGPACANQCGRRAPGADLLCQACAFEQELFDRDLRWARSIALAR
jgi:pimeloyl-ACP methyl ester carboxylesterase